MGAGSGSCTAEAKGFNSSPAKKRTGVEDLTQASYTLTLLV